MYHKSFIERTAIPQLCTWCNGCNLNISPIIWAAFRPANILFSVCNCSLNDHFLANGHASPISSNISLIAHMMGDIGYSAKDPMGVTIFVCYRKHSDLSFASIQQTFAVNICSVEQTEKKFNQTFAVFAGPNGALLILLTNPGLAIVKSDDCSSCRVTNLQLKHIKQFGIESVAVCKFKRMLIKG